MSKNLLVLGTGTNQDEDTYFLRELRDHAKCAEQDKAVNLFVRQEERRGDCRGLLRRYFVFHACAHFGLKSTGRVHSCAPLMKPHPKWFAQ